MKISILNILITGVLAGSTLFISCKKDDNNNPQPVPVVLPMLTIEMDHLAGSSKFYLDSGYTTANGDVFMASMLKYYISNIRLITQNNQEYKIPNSYFLVDRSKNESMELHMDSLVAGSFKSIKFMIGVDSLRNVSGAQSGALDPINGMFWDWNIGYIHLKMEGVSPSVPSAGNEFNYHIGGFQGAYKNNREVELSFMGDQLVLANGTNPELHITVNVLEIFTNPHTIDLATFSSNVQMPNTSANMIADNYSDMFNYSHIHAD